MSDETGRNTIEIYKAMLEIEQKKSSIYSNLWTILITTLAAIFSIYITDTKNNYNFLFLIPPLIGIWAGFALFNQLYLTSIRKYIAKIEGTIDINLKNDEGKSILWYRDVFDLVIRKKLMPFLIIIVSIYLVGILGFVYYILYQNVEGNLTQYIFGFALFYAVIIIIYLYINNSIDKIKWLSINGS